MNLICFSHLRWNFVFQRPQHILSRFTKYFNIFYIEEAIYTSNQDGYSQNINDEEVTIIVPNLNNAENSENSAIRLRKIISQFIKNNALDDYFFWYYTPMALPYTNHLNPNYIIYDCMDELSAFKFAPNELKVLEKTLMNVADIVFTGGNALYEAKKSLHNNIFSFPSSIDKDHFGMARNDIKDLDDQVAIPHPRLGFYGVIDERFDIELIKNVATEKPDWQFIIIGPIVKIDPNLLPKNKNIHYLGSKNYNELPTYLSNWDVALIPFLINESTKYISPTKTPEYLSGGKPVVSSAITDVINPYRNENLVHIYTSTEEFINQISAELDTKDKSDWIKKVDEYLSKISWDSTCNKMLSLMKSVNENKVFNLKNSQNV